jgi:hypothetical protein
VEWYGIAKWYAPPRHTGLDPVSPPARAKIERSDRVLLVKSNSLIVTILKVVVYERLEFIQRGL